MKDLDLLVLAAKAAGYSQHPDGGCEWLFWVSGAYVKWNPLEDDGDALRLAVKLKFHIMEGIAQDYEGNMTIEKDMDDPYAATRRAIVRAAAEIGKAIK
jgi:hypothetical protein